jgi:hypothetical protein
MTASINQLWRTTFTSHEGVICLRCKTPLGAIACSELSDKEIRCGEFSKRCPKCHLVTSYDVSPAEAAAIELEEPDWRERFEEHCARWPKLPRYLAEDSAFEETLKEWRRWHRDEHGQAADAYTGMVALAVLKILPPRSLIKDIERTGECYQEQHDDHMWLIMSQRSWRIVALESRTLFLESFGEKTQVDLSRAKWEKYTEKAVEALMAQQKP